MQTMESRGADQQSDLFSCRGVIFGHNKTATDSEKESSVQPNLTNSFCLFLFLRPSVHPSVRPSGISARITAHERTRPETGKQEIHTSAPELTE